MPPFSSTSICGVAINHEYDLPPTSGDPKKIHIGGLSRLSEKIHPIPNWLHSRQQRGDEVIFGIVDIGNRKRCTIHGSHDNRGPERQRRRA